MKSFLLGWAFLTRLPVPEPRAWDPRDLSQSLLWFPLIGFIVGLVIGLVIIYGFTPWLGARVGVVLGYAGLVYLKDSLHLDGLSDQVDALAGARDPKERQEILDDPATGAMGAISLILVILIHVSALLFLEGRWLVRGLGLAVGLGTTASALSLCWANIRGGSERLASSMASYAGTAFGPILLIFSALFAGLLAGFPGLLIWLLMPLITALLAGYLVKEMNGLSGDGCGLIATAVQTVVLLAMIAAKPLFEIFWGGFWP